MPDYVLAYGPFVTNDTLSHLPDTYVYHVFLHGMPSWKETLLKIANGNF
jgi:hypothetical protein